MTQTHLDIDRVVREVLAELKRAPASSSSSSPTTTIVVSSESTAKTPPPKPSGSGELVLSMRLVTMEDIGDKLNGIRCVVVNPQAVVTPAVRDALRQRNITLSRVLTPKNASIAPLKLVIVAARSKFDAKLLANTLQSDGLEVKCHTTDCIIDATDRLAGELAEGNALGLLITPHTAAALCLANRLPVLRAVLGCDGDGVESDIRAVGANLLVADPQNISLFKLCRMAGEFFRGGMRPCPDVFRKRLT
jgi:hypothetical protein